MQREQDICNERCCVEIVIFCILLTWLLELPGRVMEIWFPRIRTNGHSHKTPPLPYIL